MDFPTIYISFYYKNRKIIKVHIIADNLLLNSY